MKAEVLFVLFASAIVVGALYLLPKPGVMAMPVSADDVNDVWTTPYYLRANVPPINSVSAYLPIPSNYAYALGVPSAPYTQQAVVSS